MRSIVILAIGFCALCAHGSYAQEYPARPVRIVVPFAANGPADIIARIAGQKMMIPLGQQAILDNRAGAGGLVGAEYVAKSAPDGYTLLLCGSGVMAINPNLERNLPYDPIHDFAPIANVASFPSLLVVHPSLPVNSVKELIALAKSKPNQLNFGSAGPGSNSHLSGELFKTMAKVQLTHVPYKGMPQAEIDAIAGQVQILFESIPGALPLVKAGRLHALGISTLSRSPLVPNIPTISESGVANYSMVTWQGFCAPAATSSSIVEKLNKELVRAVKDKELVERFAGLGASPIGNSPEAFRDFIGKELKQMQGLIKDSGLKIQQ